VDLGIGGRVALVPASSQGLGFACAAALVGEGANVVVTGRRTDVLEAAAGRLRERTGCEVVAITGDMSDPTEPRRLVEETVDRFGRLDIVVPNAGGPPIGRSLEVTPEQIEEAVNGNLLSTVRLVEESLPHLRQSPGPRVCCLASVTVFKPIATLSLSNVTRSALWAWVKDAASELRGDGITLNLICPGPHSGERSKSLGLDRVVGDPNDLGKIVAFLCSDWARFISGAAIVVDGGAPFFD
jgi:3-oxoacyl-[acyl-carrier protein] reductase